NPADLRAAEDTKIASAAPAAIVPLGGPVQDNQWLTCANCRLTIKNSETSFIFQLDVVGTDKKSYYLQATNPAHSRKLIQEVMMAMAETWPDYNFQFQANALGAITAVKVK